MLNLFHHCLIENLIIDKSTKKLPATGGFDDKNLFHRCLISGGK
jgi:hypothetical protein